MRVLLTRTDDTFDDNADDSHTPNNAHDSPKTVQSCLFSDLARSWQCGGQGPTPVIRVHLDWLAFIHRE